MTRSPLEDGLFPISIYQEPPTTLHATLRSIILTTPIHVHTPVAHIGVVHGGATGECTNALELMQFVQSLVSQPVNLPINYDILPQDMRVQVDVAFAQRIGCSQCSSDSQNQHLSSALWPGDNIIGSDLLLGNDEVWGFERVSFEGYSVLHLAKNSPRR